MHTERLERLIQVGRSLVAELEIETVLGNVLDAAREITGARYAALGILDESRTGLERFVTSGIDPAAHASIGDLPRGRGVLGVLIDEPRPVRLHDVSAHPQSYGFPGSHPPMSSFLGVPVVIHGSAWGNLYLTEKDGGDFTEDDEEAAVVLADWAAIAIANARLYRDVAARRDDLERAVRGLETTTEIARALGGETEIDRILELVVKRARALVGARLTFISLAHGGQITVAQAAGEFDPALIGYSVPIADSVTGFVLRARRPERLADVGSRMKFRLGQMTGATSGLMVPLIFRDRPLGVLSAFDRLGDDPEFHAEDERLLLAFAASAAIAVATAQDVQRDAMRRTMKASDEERRRWARELHDETLQDLGALRVFLSGARRSGDVGQLQDAMSHAVEELARGIDDLRTLITELRPAALDELGLGPALDGLVDRLDGRTPVRLHLDTDLAFEQGRATNRLHPDVEAAAFRIVQEALTNVSKHAGGATRATIEVVERGSELVVAVADDGPGFDLAGTTHGFGLLGMRERAALVDGSVTVSSAPGEGTTVSAKMPVRRAGAAGAEPPLAATG